MFAIGRFHQQLHSASAPLILALNADADVNTVISAAQQSLAGLSQAHQVAANAASRAFVSANETLYGNMAATAEHLFAGAHLIATCLVDEDTFDVDQYQQGVSIVIDAYNGMNT